jgi:CO/xanthine dehydrogenase FAD-binding subunit
MIFGVIVMINEYHRPEKLEEALELLARAEPTTIPLGGGSALDRFSSQSYAVVDLQSLGFNKLQQRGNNLVIGATVTLQSLVEEIERNWLPNLAGLVKAIKHEATYNLRQVGTVAGALVSANGRSPFSTAMLALDAELTLEPGEAQERVGDVLLLRQERLPGKLITTVTIPTQVQLAYEYVARSPADLPIVCAAVTVWPSGRVRVALGGHGRSPVLAFDGTEAEGVVDAARSAYSLATDEWASAAYREDAAGILAQRALIAAQA